MRCDVLTEFIEFLGSKCRTALISNERDEVLQMVDVSNTYLLLISRAPGGAAQTIDECSSQFCNTFTEQASGRVLLTEVWVMNPAVRERALSIRLLDRSKEYLPILQATDDAFSRLPPVRDLTHNRALPVLMLRGREC